MPIALQVLREMMVAWPVNMFWTGRPLGIVERLSIRSYQQHGHVVRLHTYGEVGGVPDGVEMVDAARTVSREALSAFLQINRPLASDYFRYMLLRASVGLWSDTDMLCLAPIKVYDGILMGRENTQSINSAILYLEPGSPILRDILHAMKPNTIPAWAKRRERRRAWLMRLRGARFGLEAFKWGTYGPAGITALARKHGLEHLADPVDVFYPLPVDRWMDVWQDGSSFDTYRTERTKAMHLWHSSHDDAVPHPRSAIGRLAAELGV